MIAWGVDDKNATISIFDLTGEDRGGADPNSNVFVSSYFIWFATPYSFRLIFSYENRLYLNFICYYTSNIISTKCFPLINSLTASISCSSVGKEVLDLMRKILYPKDNTL